MKVVVYSTNWIGDTVMSIPALKEIRRIFADAEITLCARSWTKDMLQDANFIDKIFVLDKVENPVKFLKQLRLWRKEQFDIAVIFPNSFRSALLAKLGGTKKIFGYATDKRSFLLTKSFPVPDWKSERHEAFFYLNLVSEIEKTLFGRSSVSAGISTPEIPICEERRRKAREILESSGVDLSRKMVALGVGSTNSLAKRWHIDGYAELNDMLQFELEANTILLGSKDEADVAGEVFKKARIKPINLVGKTSLAEAIGLLAEVNLLISNDIGLAHVAPAVGTKTITIFGPTNEKATRPIGSEIIRKDVECAPCMLRKCPIDHRCMKLISAREVFIKARQLLT
jgi:heptosyltransferase II